MTRSNVAPLGLAEWLFLCLAMAATLFLGATATTSGPGISPDSTGYLRSAINLQSGHGFTLITAAEAPDGVTIPFTSQPPLFPILLALLGVGQPGRTGIEAAGQWIPIVAAFLALVPLYLIGRMLSGIAAGVAGVLFAAALSNFVWLASYTWSDTTFILLTAIGLAGMTWLGIARPDGRRLLLGWALLGLVAALANLTRTVGAFVWLAGLVALAQTGRQRGWRVVVAPGTAFTLIWLVLTVPWYLRNLRLAGTLSGYAYVTDRVHVGWFESVRTLALTAAADLSPRLHFGLRTLPPAVVVAVIIAIGLLVLMSAATLARRRPPRLSEVAAWPGWPLAVYVGTSLAGLAVIGATVQIYPGEWTRYAGSVYPFVGVLAAVLVVAASRSLAADWPEARQRRVGGLVAVLAVAIWVLGYARPVTGFAAAAGTGQQLRGGEWRTSPTVAFIRDRLPESPALYTDRTDALWYFTGHNARALPLAPDATAGIDRLWATVALDDDDAYLVVFAGDLRDPFRVTTEQLEAADPAHCVTPLARLVDGTVLKVSSVCLRRVQSENTSP
jgi:hypothetical protein